MGFFRVKASSNKEAIVNRDCGAKIVLDFLKDRFGITDKEQELDLCDEWGNLRFLTQAPPRCSCLQLVASRALYTPVLIKQKPAMKFEFPMGLPVATTKLRETVRKVRRQWDKLQKLRCAAGGQFCSDEEAAEVIAQVVGPPSAEGGKSKGKARDPAPRPARQPRALSASKKKRATTSVDSSEEKENQMQNNVNKTEKNAAIDVETKGKLATVIEESNTGDNYVASVKSESKKSSTNIGAREIAETRHNDKPTEEVMANSKAYTTLEETETRNLPGGGQTKEAKDMIIELATNDSNKPMQDNERKEPTIPIEAAGTLKVDQTGQSDAKTANVTEIPMELTQDIEKRSIPRDQHINESTDSGIESAVSRTSRRLKDKEPREFSIDGQFINAEAGSNEESTGQSVLSPLQRNLNHSRSLNMPATTEHDDLTVIDNMSTVPQLKIQASDKEERPSGYACASSASEARNIDGEANITSEEVQADGNSTEETIISVPVIVTQDMCDDQTRNDPGDVTSETAQSLPVTASAMKQIRGVTVSIMPPSCAEKRRGSVDVTTLLGLQPGQGAAVVGADDSTGRTIPSLIDRDWRTEEASRRLAGVLSGTSKLMFLGSVKSTTTSDAQIDVSSTTATDVEQLAVHTAALATDGAAQN